MDFFFGFGKSEILWKSKRNKPFVYYSLIVFHFKMAAICFDKVTYDEIVLYFQRQRSREVYRMQ